LPDTSHPIESSPEFSARYALGELIGAGGFARVFRATQHSTGQTVAVKILERPADGTNDASSRAERFQHEVRICASLNHTHIVPLIDSGATADGWLYAVFDFKAGRTLAALLAEEGSLEPDVATYLMTQVLDAIGFAHESGVYHRDLKPANIIISEELRRSAFVLDFGIGRTEASDLKLTATNEALGTPAYAPPEQLRGQDSGARGDLYSWGLVFLEALTGTPAVGGASIQEIISRQMGPEPIPIPESVHSLPVGRAIAAALAKSPDERPSSARELMGWLTNATGLMSSTSVRGTTEARTKKLQIIALNLRATWSDEALSVENAQERVREFQEAAEAVVRDHGGVPVSRHGSMIVALFGYPQARERAARSALLAAATVRDALAADAADGPKVRAGINSGMAVVADEAGASLAAQPLTSPILDRAMDLASAARVGEIRLCDRTRSLLREAAPLEPVESDDGSPVHKFVGDLATLSGPGRYAASTTIVGRDAEIGQIAETWREAHDGVAKALLVTGEAGIGKSRIIHEARSGMDTAEWVPFRCTPETQNSPLHPIVEWLRAWDQNVPLGESLSNLGYADDDELHGLLDDLLGKQPDLGRTEVYVSPERKRQLVMEGILQLWFAGARDHPLVILFEDLHWADPSTLELLNALVQEVRSSGIFDPTPSTPLLLLMTARTEFQPPWSLSDVPMIQLSRISPEEATRLVHGMAPESSPLDETLVSDLVARADGVPFFVEELTRMVLEARESEGRTRTATHDIPATLRDLLSARFERLPEPARRTAQIASCLGRHFDFETLDAVSERGETRLREDLEILIRSGLAYRRRAMRSENFVFNHALLRDTAHDSMVDKDRRGVHAEIAEHLAKRSDFQELAAQQPEIIAYHHEEAGLLDSAIELRLKASALAGARSAHIEVASHLQRAIDLLPELPASDERDLREIHLRLALGNHRMMTMGYAAEPAEHEFARAKELCDKHPESPATFKALNGLWGYHINRGNLEESVALAARQSELADRSGLLDHQLHATNAEASNAYYYGDFRRSLPILMEATRYYEEAYAARMASGNKRPWRTGALSSPMYCAHCLQLVGRADEGLAMTMAALDQAQSLGIHAQVQAMIYASGLYLMRREPERALDVSDRIIGLSKEYGFRAWRSIAMCTRGWARSRLGELEEGLEENRKAIAAYTRTGAKLPLVQRRYYLAETQFRAEQFDDAIATIDLALEDARDTLEHFYDAEMGRLRGEALRGRGDQAEAESAFLAALKLAREQGARLFELRTLTSLARLPQDRVRSLNVGAQLKSCLGEIEQGLDTEDLVLARQALEAIGKGEASDTRIQAGS
jgi:TOMM system kinase/cyclase fusion protein